MFDDTINPYSSQDIQIIRSTISRRKFLSGVSLTVCLTACGGSGNNSSSFVQLPTTPLAVTPTAEATSTALATQTVPADSEALSPSSNWTGVAGSGFTGNVPIDPVRTTAKPVLRPLQPSNLWFTDFLTIGVWAAARSDNWTSDNLGIAKVILHYEGNRTEITSPSVYTFTDANGVTRQYFGWWAKIAKPSNRAGHARVYWEAVPIDTTMQSRVIGPLQYSPQASLFDANVVIAPSQPTLVGKSYPTIQAALEWCASNKRQNPLITIVEPGTYDLGRISRIYQGEGYANITATVPVRICASPGGLGYWRPSYTGLHFMSDKITIDFLNSGELFVESSTIYNYNRPAWFDGCNLTNSAGKYSLVNKAPRNALALLVRARPCFTEATITNLWNPACRAALVRGNTFNHCWGDLTGNSEVVIGNRVDKYDSSDYRNELACLSVVYTGPASTASLSMDGFNNMARTLTARTTDSVYTFRIETSASAASSNTNYSVSNVVDWLNSLPGWSARLLDDSRRAACIQKSKTVTVWTVDNVKNNATTLYTMVDIHPDFYQTWAMENAVVADNVLTNSVCQNIFLKDGYSRDIFIVNNSFHNLQTKEMGSQLASVHSHVVIIHNSSSGQVWAMRTDFTGAVGSTAEKYQPDRYCLFSHNVAPRITWGAAPVSNLLQNNHIFSGSKAPANSIGTTIGGTEADLFANPSAGDFAPRGALISNRRRPLVRFDQARVSRPESDAVGARSSTAPRSGPA